jgi:uncharacterized protein (UPF0212 family)
MDPEETKETKEEQKSRLKKHNKQWAECPKCGEVFEGAFSVVSCNCGYRRPKENV